jgi:hypothetical protein
MMEVEMELEIDYAVVFDNENYHLEIDGIRIGKDGTKVEAVDLMNTLKGGVLQDILNFYSRCVERMFKEG